MKNLFIILSLLLFSFAAKAQEAADTTKADKRKSWEIQLNEKQLAAITEIDAKIAQLNNEFAKLQEARTQYFKAILEAKDIDVAKITDFQYKQGKLVFVELKPRK